MSYTNSPFGTGTVNMRGTTNLLQLRNRFYQIVNEPNTSAVYASTLVDEVLNEKILELASLWKWKFLRQQVVIPFISPKGLDTDVEPTDTTITLLDVDGMPDAGALMFGGQIVEYDGIVGATLQNVMGNDVFIPQSTLGNVLYNVPSDYLRNPNLSFQESGTGIYRGIPYVDAFALHTSEFAPPSVSWTMVTSNSGKQYITLSNMWGSSITYLFQYQCRPNILVLDTDICIIPDPYALKVIPTMTASTLMNTFGDNMDGLGDTHQAQAEKEIQQMKKLFGYREEGFSKLVTPTYRPTHGGHRPYVRV